MRGRAPEPGAMVYFRIDVSFFHDQQVLDLTLAQQALLLRLRCYAAEFTRLPLDLWPIVRRAKGKRRDVPVLEEWFPIHPSGGHRWDPVIEEDRARLVDLKRKRAAAGQLGGLAAATARDDASKSEANPEEDQRKTGASSEKASSKVGGLAANAEHLLGADLGDTTVSGAGKVEASAGRVQQMPSHSVHAVQAVQSVQSPQAVRAESGATGAAEGSAPERADTAPAWRSDLAQVIGPPPTQSTATNQARRRKQYHEHFGTTGQPPFEGFKPAPRLGMDPSDP